ncbi:hypothetical protein BDQ17DRAFT_1430566 [Cyathus striatus]|nr:hypothetical protein BDQ17DRAFT_1430566 [Cyathus striatus]
MSYCPSSFSRENINFFLSAGFTLIVTSVEIIFAFRVCALYGNSMRAVLFLATWLIVQFMFAVCLAVFTSISESADAFAVEGVGCLNAYSSDINLSLKVELIYYFSSFGFHSALLILTLKRAGRELIFEHGGLRSIFRTTETGAFSPVLTSIVRDGTLYFCVLFVSVIFDSVMGMILVFDSTSTFSAFAPPFYVTVLSFVGSRLILKLRKLVNVNANMSNTELSRAIFFARFDPGLRTEEVEDTGRLP